MKQKLVYWAIIAALVVLLIQQTFFTVDVMEHVVVTLFGEPRVVYTNQLESSDQAGLKVKIPFFDKVYRFDNRLRVYESAESEFLTVDKNNIVVTFYALWRVKDPLQYFISVRERTSAESKLDKVIFSRLGTAFGKADFATLINVEEEQMRLGETVDAVARQCRADAEREYGIELVDLRLKRLSFPDQVRQSVLNRIRSERQAKSREVRSEGEARATEIRAQADYESAKILAEARKQATIRIGQGEATTARIWRETLEENLDFYQFQKNLEVYEKGIDKDTVLFIPADSPLMELLLQGPGDKTMRNEK